jgi:glycosyltransferase involved in cell wall biosynthesis
VKIGILAAGAGGMYCGSCMRDNDMAMALKRLGHDVTLVPLFTPLRTENENESIRQVFYGGINIYLQYASALFRHTPRAIDWLLDRPRLLGLAGSLGAQTAPDKLADFTLDILRGEEGHEGKELRRLIGFLKEHVRPQVISLPNLMFIGVARLFREELNVPVVCELTGEDIFLDAMQSANRKRMKALIRERAGDVSRFVATSEYYAERMAKYLDIGRDRIDVVYTGVTKEYLAPTNGDSAFLGRLPTVGYLARICPEKGFDQVLEAFAELVELPGMHEAQLKIAGYLGSRDAKWAKGLLAKLAKSKFRDSVTFLGEVDREQKLAMLNSIDVFTVPTRYPESKGVYVLEALARGVPVVQPDHGAFPEMIRRTGGGLLTPPGDATQLAHKLAELLGDAPRRRVMGHRGRAAIAADFTDEQMARGMLKVFESVTQ